jgi:hypothetical protein
VSEDEAFSKAVRRKAAKLVRDGKVEQDPEYAYVWWVGSATEEGQRPYRVELTTKLASCSCRYGLLAGGGDSRCSHVLAAARVKDRQRRGGP